MVSWRYCPICGAANTVERERCLACGGALGREMEERKGEGLLQERDRVLTPGGGQQRPQRVGQGGGKTSRRAFVVGGITAGAGLLVGFELLTQGRNAAPPKTTTSARATPPELPTSSPTSTELPAPPAGRILSTIADNGTSFDGLAWSPDNKRIACFSYDGFFQVWDARTGKQLVATSLSGVQGVSGLSWSPNSQFLALPTDQYVLIVDAQSGQIAHTLGNSGGLATAHPPAGQTMFASQFPTSGSAGFATAAWSPDGRYVAGSQYDNLGKTIQVWDAQSGKYAFALSITGAYEAQTVDWSFDGQYIAASLWQRVYANGVSIPSSNNGKVVVWDVATRKIRSQRPLQMATNLPFSYSIVAFQPASHNLAFLSTTLANAPSTLEIWDIAANKQVQQYALQTSGLFAWSPNGAYLAYAGAEKALSPMPTRVAILNPASGTTASAYMSQKTHIAAFTWSPDSKYIASSEYDVDPPSYMVPHSNAVVVWG